MKTRLAAFAALAVLVAPAPAGAETPPGPGRRCGLHSVGHPLDHLGERYAGVLDAGPIVIADGPALRTGRVVCTVQLNSFVHSAPDAAAASSPTTAGVVALPPTPVEYVAPPDAWVVVCTHVEIDGVGTFYWDGSGWATDDSAQCLHGDPDLLGPVRHALDWLFVDVVDPATCAVFGEDVYVLGELFWDCPPYDPGR